MSQRAVESEVRSYSRAWPVTFATATGSVLTASDGVDYLDFFAGAGALNYGHNNPIITEAIMQYIRSGGIMHSLDMATEAKEDFLDAFGGNILRRRALDYRVQFCGPTGTNAVEAALKLARKVTGRSNVIAFTQAFHGVSLGALGVTAGLTKRRAAGVSLADVTRLPFEDAVDGCDGLALFDHFLSNGSSGVDKPAAVIVETIQGEGGVNVASAAWLQRLQRICRSNDVLLIVDEVQMGCGRTGPFFSWESAGLSPDIICLSKSIGGIGLPFALTLMRPALDLWAPGEHNGTFRGNNLAFVAGSAALRTYWHDDTFASDINEKAQLVAARLQAIVANVAGVEVRGRGLIWGLAFDDHSLATSISRVAFQSFQLLVETCGAFDEVVKLLPPLTVSAAELDLGLDRLEAAVTAVISRSTLVAL